MQITIDGHDIFIASGIRVIDPDLETVVFIHGTGQDHSIWVLPTRYFTRHDRNVLAVDLPGHGRSAGEPLETVEKMADWVIRVLDKTGISRAALVGHSLGSLIALAAAARHPKRVRSIALVAVSVPMPVSPRLLDYARQNRHEALEMLNYWGFSKSAQLGGSATPGNWMLGAGMRLMEKARPGVIYKDLKACNEYSEGLAHAEQAGCPALLILGERDMLTPVRSAHKVLQALPNAEHVILPGCGHALLSEQPDPVLHQLTRVV
jgi:pimeloyl-ACP methyl ester carboxylesterase